MTQATTTGKSRGWAARPRWWGAALVVGLALAGCPQQPPAPPAPAPGPGAGVLPVIPAEARALVHGTVNSPVFDELKKRLTLTRYTGSQKMTDHDLLVLDGDAHSPEALRTDPLVAEAVRTRKWVAALDLTPEHKRAGLGDHLRIASKRTSAAYLFRMVPLGDGRSAPRILDAAKPGQPAPDRVGAQGQAGMQVSARAGAADLAGALMKALGEPARITAQAVPGPDNPQPADLLWYQWPIFSKIYTYTLPGTHNNPGGSQTGYMQVDQTISVYLNNSNNPMGDYQYVLDQVQVTMNPTNGTGKFAVNGGGDIAANKLEKGWFQDRLQLTLKPDESNTLPFTYVNNAPQSANAVAQYTTSSGFSVGFQGASLAGSYTWGSNQTQTLSDWKVSSNGSGTSMSWNFRSGNPDTDKGYQNGDWFSECVVACNGFPKTPNELSTGQNVVQAAVTYRTQQVDTAWETLAWSARLNLVDTYCSSGAAQCNQEPAYQTYYELLDDEVTFDMSVVLPPKVKSVTLNPNPVGGGLNVTGTVTMENAAPVDVKVPVSSAVVNASPEQVVVVYQGQRTANFNVITNANGIAQGDFVDATITAGTGVLAAQSALRVFNPRIVNVTFNPNPVAAGLGTTGTVTMSAPVSSETTVFFRSDSLFATPQTSVTVPTGSASATFSVSTNPTGIPAGGQAVATITAEYGSQNYTGQLTVGNPSAVSVQNWAFDYDANNVRVGDAPGLSSFSGWVYLNAPAQFDTTIFLQSSSPNVTVQPSITLYQGQTVSGAFDVRVKYGSIPPGGSLPVTLQANVSSQFTTVQLTLRNYPAAAFLPPKNAPNFIRWNGLVPIPPNWVVGYQVRYAVSFVDAAGNESDRGPWTIGFQGLSNQGRAQPTMNFIATDPSGRAVKRNIYRQFLAGYNVINPTGGVTLVGTINDNTTTTFTDTTP